MRLLLTIIGIFIVSIAGPIGLAQQADLGGGQQILEQQRRSYNERFKEIQFVFLEGGEAWEDDICILNLLLGHKPSSLNYEHPAELRQDLMDASVTVLVNMLRTQIPYAALFKADTPLGWRENVCVISIDPQTHAGSDRQASGFLFDLTPQQAAQLPHGSLLDAGQFLYYLIDHEAYHCLDAFYNGPQPMSHNELWGEYHNLRRENGADAYALAMNIKRRGGIGDFARAVQAYRGMAVFKGDPDHWSYDAIARVFQLPPQRLQAMSAAALFGQASEIRDQVVGDYPAYLRYSATAAEAFLRLHPQPQAGTVEIPAELVDQVLLQRLIRLSEGIRARHPYLAQ